MEKPRVVFMGTPVFAVSILETLVTMDVEVVAICSQPDKPVGRKKVLTPTPTHAFATAHQIPVVAPNRLKDEVESVLDFHPDLIITCAYGQMVPEAILNAPKYGCLNIHPSLLPKYRGGAPVHHAIWNGDTQTGVCLMQMVKAMDAGDIYDCRTIEIDPDDTTETLNKKLEVLACQQLSEVLPRYLQGECVGIKQDDSKMVLAKTISPEQEQVHFQKEPIDACYNHVRAFIDWPISYGVVEGKRVKFYAAKKENGDSGKQPGTILGFENHAMRIACAQGVLCVQKLQLEGKSVMDADSFANGAGRALIGKVFD